MKKKAIALSMLFATSILFVSCMSEHKNQEDLDYEIEDVNLNILDEENKAESTTTKVESDSDWDVYLSEYEQFIDKYVDMLKKAKTGDISAISDYSTYLEKANNLQLKMSEAKSQLTTAQLDRFVKLQNKLTNAVSSLY